MDTISARTAVKQRLDIDSTVTTFDAQIDAFVLAAVDRLFPVALNELAPQTVTVAPDTFGEVFVDLSTLSSPASSVRRVEAYGGYEWYAVDHTYHHGSNLVVRSLSTSVTQLKLYGLTAFTLTTIPAYLKQVIYWFAMSEFYSFLAGNKSKFNIYAAGAARAMGDMKEEADYYEQKANIYLNDRAELYGVR